MYSVWILIMSIYSCDIANIFNIIPAAFSVAIKKRKEKIEQCKFLLPGFEGKRAPPAQPTSFPDSNVYLSSDLFPKACFSMAVFKMLFRLCGLPA